MSTEGIMKLISPYELRARTFPGVLMLAPAAAVSFILLPFLHSATAAGTAALFWLACAYVVGQGMRDRAEPQQKALWSAWGGSPTTQLLRWSNTEISRQEKVQTRSTVLGIGGFQWPDEAEEAAKPAEADEHYTVLVKAVLSDARRHPDRYERQDRANAHYGFQRNCYYSRSIGVLIASVSAILAGISMFFPGLVADWKLVAVVDLVCIAVLLFWIFGITAGRLRQSADTFAIEVFRHMPVLVESRKSAAA